jgi:hypothetical protein
MPSPPTALLGAALCLLVAGCATPGASDRERPRERAPREDVPSGLGAQVLDERVRSVQLFLTGQEATLPVFALGTAQTLTLAFDMLTDDGGRTLDVSFVHTDRSGEQRLLPSEYLTGFERDNIRDYRPSGSPAVPYVHYRYDFPNSTIGFRLSGAYRLQVHDGGGDLLLDLPFFVTENAASVTLAYGATLAGGRSAGLALQPAARVEPGPRLADFQAYQYTVCFARDGRLDALRCAPEPSLVQQALFQYYLPADEAFAPTPPRFGFDLGLLAMNDQVVDVDRTARPPTAVLDVDAAEFGGEIAGGALGTAPEIESVYRDVGQAQTDAEYVSVRFRYAPASGTESARPLYVVGSFNGWRAEPAGVMTWLPDERRYEATLLLKQGRYVYGYALPGGPPLRGATLGQATIFTALVFLADPQTFTDRLVAVESIVAR